MSGNEVQYNIPAGVQIVKLGYRESGYDADLSGSFTSNDKDLNTLWTKAQRTLYLNMRDSYTDCPTRERALWWGDAVIEIEQTFYALDRRADLLSRNAINTLIGWQRSDKTMSAPVPGNYDTELPVQILASIGMSGFWTYFLHSGDLGAMTAAYPHVKSYLSVWTRSANGLVVHRAGGWDWSDWGTNIDVPLLDNAWYYMALDAAARMAEVIELLRELLIGSVIFLNDAPIAIQLVYRVEAPDWISVEYVNGGVDPETREFSPGSVLSFLNTQSAWEHARALGKPLRFSFGRADREYKDRWCNPVPVFTV
jgi:hypothetical protein